MSSPADIYYNRDTDVLAIPNSENNTVIFESFGSSISFTCGLMGCMELSDNTGKYTTLEDCEADCETIALDEFNTEERLFYPNPIQNGGNIIWQSEDAEVEIYNLQGQLIQEAEITSNKLELNTSNLQNGIFFVDITQGKEKITKKIILHILL